MTEQHTELANIELLTIIVNFGMGSKVLHIAKQCGINGGTICLARGTVSNRILDLLGLSDIRKEVVRMISSKEAVHQLVHELDQEFKFEKPNHGIAFTTSICSVIGSRRYSSEKQVEGTEGDRPMYHAIHVVVDRGRAEDVVDAANKAGSRGATIINARGSGIHETSKVFAMDIVPEKEIVLILSESDKTEGIVESIRQHLHIDEPGKGIIYIQEVNKTYGLYKP
jgi:nitrogen regulatory protein PII